MELPKFAYLATLNLPVLTQGNDPWMFPFPKVPPHRRQPSACLWTSLDSISVRPVRIHSLFTVLAYRQLQSAPRKDGGQDHEGCHPLDILCDIRLGAGGCRRLRFHT